MACDMHVCPSVIFTARTQQEEDQSRAVHLRKHRRAFRNHDESFQNLKFGITIMGSRLDRSARLVKPFPPTSCIQDKLRPRNQWLPVWNAHTIPEPPKIGNKNPIGRIEIWIKPPFTVLQSFEKHIKCPRHLEISLKFLVPAKTNGLLLEGKHASANDPRCLVLAWFLFPHDGGLKGGHYRAAYHTGAGQGRDRASERAESQQSLLTPFTVCLAHTIT